MPISTAELEAFRTGAGCTRIARDFLFVEGPDAESYLQGQISQDLDTIEIGESKESLVLSPQGKLDAFVRITRTGPGGFLLDVDQGWGSGLTERLERFKLRSKLAITGVPLSVVAVRGLRAEELEFADIVERIGMGVLELVAAPGFPAEGEVVPSDGVLVAKSYRGFDVLCRPEAAAATLQAVGGCEGLTPCGAESFEAWRIESGMPLMGVDLNESTIAQEAGLVERAASFTKGCYTGQELIARIDSRGRNVPKRLCRFASDLMGSDFGAGETGETGATGEAGDNELAVNVAGEPAGTVTSWVLADRMFAFCYVKRGTDFDARSVVTIGGVSYQGSLKAALFAA